MSDMHRITAGMVLGIGLGGFFDGIVLHQIAQWHSMGSAVLPPTTMEAMRQNMRWDGMFHGATWTVCLVGVYMLRSAAERGRAASRRAFTGELLVGWGGFNIAEGVINHHLLNVHHVRDLPTHVPMYDWWFLAGAGLGLLAAGLTLMRRARVRVS